MGYERGNVCHIEIAAPDLEKMKRFYQDLFGWSFAPMGPGYEFFDAGNVKGAFDSTATPSRDGTILVLACDDIDASLEAVGAAGGETLRSRTEIGGGHGFYAYFADPAGNRMGLWTPA